MFDYLYLAELLGEEGIDLFPALLSHYELEYTGDIDLPLILQPIQNMFAGTPINNLILHALLFR